MEFQIQSLYQHQVAGHHSSLHSLIIDNPVDGSNIKAIAKKYCQKETLFYEAALKFHPNVIGTVIPKYYGIFKSPQAGKSHIVIEDLLSEYTNPSIIDIKVGSRTYDDEASKEKKDNRIQKCLLTTSSSLFFRISGMKVWNGVDYEFHDKSYCNRAYNLSSETIILGIKKFVKEFSIASIVERLTKDILDPLSNHFEAELYSSSLLIYYDSVTDRCGCSIIDFAHSKWTPGVSIHYDYVTGIKNIIDLFHSLLNNKATIGQ